MDSSARRVAKSKATPPRVVAKHAQDLLCLRVICQLHAQLCGAGLGATPHVLEVSKRGAQLGAGPVEAKRRPNGVDLEGLRSGGHDDGFGLRVLRGGHEQVHVLRQSPLRVGQHSLAGGGVPARIRADSHQWGQQANKGSLQQAAGAGKVSAWQTCSPWRAACGKQSLNRMG